MFPVLKFDYKSKPGQVNTIARLVGRKGERDAAKGEQWCMSPSWTNAPALVRNSD